MATGNQPSDVFNDPKFYALPEDSQRAVVSYKDPRFKQLSPEGQRAVIANRRAEYQKKSSPSTAPPVPEAAPWYQSIVPRAEKYVEGLITSPPKPTATKTDKVSEPLSDIQPVAAHKPSQPPILPSTAKERLLANPPGKTEIGPVNPGVWQRLYETVAGPNTVLGKVLKGEAGIPLSTSTVDLGALFTNMGYNKTTASRIAGGLRSAADFVSGMTDVPNLEIIAASGGAGTLAKGLFGKIAESGVSRLISAGFGAQLLYGLYKAVPEFKKAVDQGDEVKARNIAIAGGLSGYFGVTALTHAAGLAKEEASKTPESTKEGAEGPPKPSVQALDPTAPQPEGKELPTPHKFSSTQADLPKAAADKVLSLSKEIEDSDLAGDGRETRPHVTVKYGLHDDDPSAVESLLKQEGPIELTLGKTGFFPPSKGSEGNDVVYVEVDSPQLHDLNKKISDNLKVTDTHPEYKPHITVAYVKPGTGVHYAEDSRLAGQKVTVSEITFSGADGKESTIKLGGAGAQSDQESGKLPTPTGSTPKAVSPPASPKEIVEAQGLVYHPSEDGNVWFSRPKSDVTKNDTFMIPEGEFSEKAIKEKLAAYQKEAAAKKPPVPTANLNAKLPRDLAGSQPRYGYRDKLFGLEFESDVDKALYTIAQRKPNKAHDKFMDFLRGVFPGESEAQLKARGNEVKARIKEMAAGADPTEGPLTVKSENPTAQPTEPPPVPTAAASAILHSGPQELAGVEPDPTGHRVVTNPIAFIESMANGAPPPGGTLAMPVASLTLAPEEMQFRSDEGLLSRKIARGPINTWEPNFAGAVDVWFDPSDSKVKVVNGHDRTESAGKLGIHSINVHFIETASASDARAWGAIKNIAEGTATPYDAAVYFRETGQTPDDLAAAGLSVNGSVARDGLALSRLSNELFERVRKGEMTERTGVAIGASLESHDLQRGLAELIDREAKRGKRLSSEEISTLAEGRMRRAGETVSTMQTLFGTESVSNSNAVEAARLETWVKKQLSKDRRLFGFVADKSRAETLGRAGNTIKVDENRRIASTAAEAEEVFGRLLYRAGEVEDVINDGAARIGRGEDENAVRENVYGRIKTAVQKAISGGERPNAPVGENVHGRGSEAPPEGGGLFGELAAAPPNGGGRSPDEALRSEHDREHGARDVVAGQQGVAGTPEAGRPAGTRGLVSEAESSGIADPPKYGDSNRFFKKDQLAERRARIQKSLNVPKIGIEPQLLADVTWMAAYHFEAGVRSFGEWSDKMTGEFGDWIEPHLERLWSFVSHRVSTSEALANVKPATIHVPLDPRPAMREASEWSLSLDEANIQSTAPAPKVKISPENEKRLVYFGQKELAELALSALTRPGSEKPGFVLAASTGTGKTYIGATILSELKPKSALILTTNQGLVDKTINVGRQFDLDIQRLPPVSKGIPPEGHFITTYSSAIGYPGLEHQPWNFVMADESDAGRRWWTSKAGMLLRTLSQRADRSLFMSATPFHTPVELGYADNLGVWKKNDFEKWVSQFGVFQDENGNWIAPANPKRFAKLRLQMTDAGAFINLTPNLDGYTASFGVVPLTGEQRTKVGDIKKAFDSAVLYFTNKGRSQMARAAKAGRVVYTKSYLERARLPEAIELAKKGREKGWSIGIFTETRSGKDEIYDFLKEADEATHGQISKLLPPLPDVISTLRDAFGEDLANFSGSYSELRQSELEAFNKGEKPVIASTYAAGGRGVDMNDTSGVRPRLAIYLGPPWSGVMFDQAMGRFWRFGTKSDVFSVFLTSDSKAEFELVHGKVIPRLASLRALVKGVHDDKFTKQFQNIESALSYSQGAGGSVDPDDFVVKVESNSVNHYDKIDIPDAKEAHNKGLQIARIDDVKTTGEGFGEDNTVFKKKEAENHLENITDHMGELRSGIDPSMIHDLLYVGGFYAEGGIREFGKWSKAMTDRFGDSVREYLPEVWSVVEGKLKRQAKKAPKVKAEEPVLPGFGPALQEQKAAAGAEVGRKLTDRFNEGPMSIDYGTGKIESSPLFRGTEAAPQKEMFSPPKPSGAAEPPPEPSAGLHKPIAKGPGGKTAGAPEVEGTPLEQLTEAVKSAGKASRIKQPDTRVPLPPEISGDEKPSSALARVAGVVTDAWKLYSSPPATGSFMDSLGLFQGHLQRNTFAMQKYVKEMTKQFPDKSRREAMTNWVQASGDDETLYRWASLSKGKVRKAYQAAMTLTDEEKTAAQNVRNMLDSYWEIGKEAGILDSFIENYVPQIRKPASKYTSRVLAEIMGGILRTDFKFAKKRAFENYFEGEQAGFPALDKDIGFLTTTYVRALVKAIEGRAMVRSLLEQHAEDGRPLATVSGAGRVVTGPETGRRANFVNPNMKPEQASDYRAISHPALRKWIWAGRGAQDNPIFLQGDIIVHPSIYKHLRNVLSTSAFRQPDAEWYKRLGGAALDASSFAKQSFMGPLSTFHQVQVGIHGLMHQVNPFNPKPIDWNDKDQVGLVNSGMVVANPDGAVNFEEGLVAGGLWDQIPLAGTKLRAYKDYLFKDYIPRLKMSMGTAALERNRKTYGGKMSDDQILRLTANESNAAFGEQNYIMMGRNKTVQDALRLLLLSPDFTESRARFVGQALRPGGHEQLRALALGAVALTVSAYATSKLLKATMPDKKVEWHPSSPFSVQVGQYEFDVRSLPGDILGMVENFGPFIQARLNPVTAKPIDEALTGKDWRGQPRTYSEQVHDYFYGLVPISLQGLTEDNRHLWESVLGAFGVRARKFYSPAGKLALEIHGEDLAAKSRRHETPEMVADRQEVSKLFRALNDGVPIPPEKIAQLQSEGKISGYTAARLRRAKPGQDPFLNIFASLGIEDKLDVWDKANEEEREKLKPELTLTSADMRGLRSMSPNENKRVIARYHKAVDSEGKKEPGAFDRVEHIFDQMFAPLPSSAPPKPSAERSTAPPIPLLLQSHQPPVPEA